MAKAEISARYLPMVAPFISEEPTRFYLNGLFIEPRPEGGAFLVSTNGHVMAIVFDKSASADAAAIWPLSRALIRAARDARPQTRRLAFDGRHAELVNERGKAEMAALSEPIDGTFPNWRKLISAPVESGKPLAFNAEYLSGFRAAADGRAIQIFGTSPGPAIVRTSGTPEFLGLLMPMVGEMIAPVPAWLVAQPEAA